jgi:hypothetical protein
MEVLSILFRRAANGQARAMSDSYGAKATYIQEVPDRLSSIFAPPTGRAR